MDEAMECQYHNQCGGWCETEEEREHCLCCDCLDAEREEDAERQHAAALGEAMQRIAVAAGIELMQPKEIADIVCGRLRESVAVANAEREACAKLCDDMTTGDRVSFDWERGTSDCAHAIRARNQPTKGGDATTKAGG